MVAILMRALKNQLFKTEFKIKKEAFQLQNASSILYHSKSMYYFHGTKYATVKPITLLAKRVLPVG